MIHSYPKIYALGHPAIEELLLDDVLVEEKVDGSQFSMMRSDGQLHLRSKSVEVHAAIAGMFQRAVDSAEALAHRLESGWVYRCEFLRSPKHNTLAYTRVPRWFLVLLDVETSSAGTFLSREKKRREAERLGMEVAPALFEGRLSDPSQLLALLERESFLGGAKIEGVVVKNYRRWTRDGKTMMGKFVSEAFKEVHKKSWKERNPGQRDTLEQLATSLRTEARWLKAIQRARDAQALTNSPQDIGPLIKVIQDDIADEEREAIMEMLWRWSWPQLKRRIVAGFPEFYKELLMKEQFKCSP